MQSLCADSEQLILLLLGGGFFTGIFGIAIFCVILCWRIYEYWAEPEKNNSKKPDTAPSCYATGIADEKEENNKTSTATLLTTTHSTGISFDENYAESTKKNVRKIDFRVSKETEITELLSKDDLVLWSEEIRGGMMTGNIPPDAIMAQKFKMANDYFVHFCGEAKVITTDERKELVDKNFLSCKILKTLAVSASKVAYLCRRRDDESSDYVEEVKVEHNKETGSTWLTLEGAFHGSGIGLPMAFKRHTYDDGFEGGDWSDVALSLHVGQEKGALLDWGCEQYGRNHHCEGCCTIKIEVPWASSPSHLRHCVHTMLDSVVKQKDDLQCFKTLKRNFVPETIGALTYASFQNDLIDTEKTLVALTNSLDYCSNPSTSFIASCQEVTEQLAGLHLKQLHAIESFVSNMKGSTLTLRFEENTDLELKLASKHFDCIQRALICAPHTNDAWKGFDKKRQGSILKGIREAIVERGAVCFNSNLAHRLTNQFFNIRVGNDAACAKRRWLLVDIKVNGSILNIDEDPRLSYIRSVLFEDIEIQRQVHDFAKEIGDIIMKMRGDLEESNDLMQCVQDKEKFQDDLKKIEKDYRNQIQILEDKKARSLGKDLDKIKLYYREEHFRDSIVKEKIRIEEEKKVMNDAKCALNNRLINCKEMMRGDDQVDAKIKEKEEAVANELFEKGFSLRQLLNFVDEKSKNGILEKDFTTTDVVQKIVIPETSQKGCCYAETFHGGPQKPETLMSHWWGNKFINLVKAICEHASGKTELEIHAHSAEDLDKTFWLCIFGVNQHHSICHGSTNICNCNQPKFEVGRIKCQMDKFAIVMKSIPKHALALDAKLNTLKRIWVLSELDEAMSSKDPNKSTVYNGHVDPEILANPKVPSVDEAEASYESDKELIMKQIKKREGGIEKFDNHVKAEVEKKLGAIGAFESAKSGNMIAMKDAISKYPELLNYKNSSGVGETLLMACSEFGHIKIAQFLIKQKNMDINARSRFRNWTALHFAALGHGHPVTPLGLPVSATLGAGNYFGIVKLLFESGADPNLENDFGRTPLDEARAIGYDRRVINILSKNTCTKTDRNLQAGKFSREAYDRTVFDHNYGLRLNPSEKGGTIRLLEISKCALVTSNWVPPIGMEEGSRYTLRSPHPTIVRLHGGSLRLRQYIRYRFPSWNFGHIAITYCGTTYIFDFKKEELEVLSTSDFKAKFKFEEATIPISYGGPIQHFLYP